jgi:hypothetical protein
LIGYKRPGAVIKFFRTHFKLVLAILSISTSAAVGIYFIPSPQQRERVKLEECRSQCAPLAGYLEGQRGLPDAPADERRNHARFAKCVCR